jgi:hypothetical protein
MRQIILDANVFKVIYEDLVNSRKGDGLNLLGHVLNKDVIVVDDRDLILTQWRDCCCGVEDEYFSQWVTRALIEDKLQRGHISNDPATKKHLKNELGLPKDDLIYLVLAIGVSAFLIVSEDIHFYEPAAKKKGGEHKRKIILERSGCVCKYMERKHNVLICCIDNVKSILTA